MDSYPALSVGATSTTSQDRPADINYRPAPIRAASLQTYSFKARAASQPAGERLPAPSSPSTVSQGQGGSPLVNERFGVIGGTRAPGRFAGALAAGTQTRANSFSAGEARDIRVRNLSRAGRLTGQNANIGRTLSSHTEEHPSRTSSTSPYPTFSPSSSPSSSPRLKHADLPHSPPKAGANVSRSRSQSLALGHRPDRSLLMPLSKVDQSFRTFDKGWDTSPPEAGNHSPFSRHPPSFGEATSHNPISPAHRFTPHDFTRGWGSGNEQTALSSSVATALGGVQTTVGGFESGGKSGASSRRHSVSGFGRRDLFEAGQGMSMVSPPGRGPPSSAFPDAELLPDQLNNALSLEIDQSRRRGIEIELNSRSNTRDTPMASSLPYERSTFGQRRDPFAPEGAYGLGQGWFSLKKPILV
jgi:hypothetical protein